MGKWLCNQINTNNKFLELGEEGIRFYITATPTRGLLVNCLNEDRVFGSVFGEFVDEPSGWSAIACALIPHLASKITFRHPY